VYKTSYYSNIFVAVATKCSWRALLKTCQSTLIAS